MGVSVYLSAESIKIVQGKRNKKSIVISKLVSVPMPQGSMINGVVTNEVDITNALVDVWKRNRLSAKDIRIVVDSASLPIKVLTVPLTNENNIYSIIKREFSDVENHEDMIFDYTVSQKKLPEGGGQILAFGADRNFIGSYIDLFKGIRGAKITRITAAQESTVSFMHQCKRMDKKTYITAVIDGNILSLILFSDNLYKFSNRSRLLNEPGTPEYADEIAYAISSIIQFNRAEITDVYFFGLKEDGRVTLHNIGQLLEKQNSVVFPYMNDMISIKAKPVGVNNLTEFIYCIGSL